MERDGLIRELKERIVKQLNLAEVDPTSIDASAALFGSGLGLDSIDALELIVLMDRQYAVRITDPVEARKIFSSVNTMADHILAQRGAA